MIYVDEKTGKCNMYIYIHIYIYIYTYVYECRIVYIESEVYNFPLDSRLKIRLYAWGLLFNAKERQCSHFINMSI